MTCIRIKSRLETDGDIPCHVYADHYATSNHTWSPLWSVKFAAATVRGDIIMVEGVRTPSSASSDETLDEDDIEHDPPKILVEEHKCKVTCLEWNASGSILFSGKRRLFLTT